MASTKMKRLSLMAIFDDNVDNNNHENMNCDIYCQQEPKHFMRIIFIFSYDYCLYLIPYTSWSISTFSYLFWFCCFVYWIHATMFLNFECHLNFFQRQLNRAHIWKGISVLSLEFIDLYEVTEKMGTFISFKGRFYVHNVNNCP